MSYSIHLYLPKEREEIKGILKEVNSNTMCIINLSSINESERKRASDFLEGYMYGLEGSCVHLGENVFICAPAEISIKKCYSEEEDNEEKGSTSGPGFQWHDNDNDAAGSECIQEIELEETTEKKE